MNNAPYQPPGQSPYPMPGPRNAPGKNMILVTGILFIVFNGIGFLMTAFVLLGMDGWLWEFGGEAMRGTWTLIYTVSILLSLFAVAIGIMGVALCNKIEKGGLLMGLAIVCTVISVIYQAIYTVAILNFSGEMGISSIFGIPISLIIPILFIVGASRNKKANDAAPYEHHRGY